MWSVTVSKNVRPAGRPSARILPTGVGRASAAQSHARSAAPIAGWRPAARIGLLPAVHTLPCMTTSARIRRAQPMSRARRTAPGGPSRIDTQGSGQPIALVHAGVADRRMWAHPAAGLRVAPAGPSGYDARGYGETLPPAGPWSHHADLLALLDELAGRAAHSSATSMGAGIAVEAALARPRAVASLVLVAPGRGAVRATRRGFAPPIWTAEVEALDRGDIDAAVEVNLRGLGRRPDAGRPTPSIPRSGRSSGGCSARRSSSPSGTRDDARSTSWPARGRGRLPEIAARRSSRRRDRSTSRRPADRRRRGHRAPSVRRAGAGRGLAGRRPRADARAAGRRSSGSPLAFPRAGGDGATAPTPASSATSRSATRTRSGPRSGLRRASAGRTSSSSGCSERSDGVAASSSSSRTSASTATRRATCIDVELPQLGGAGARVRHAPRRGQRRRPGRAGRDVRGERRRILDALLGRLAGRPDRGRRHARLHGHAAGRELRRPGRRRRRASGATTGSCDELAAERGIAYVDIHRHLAPGRDAIARSSPTTAFTRPAPSTGSGSSGSRRPCEKLLRA